MRCRRRRARPRAEMAAMTAAQRMRQRRTKRSWMPSSPASKGDAQTPGGDAQTPGGDAGGAQPAEVAELEQRCAELEDRYKRALADRDNYRKRADRELQ